MINFFDQILLQISTLTVTIGDVVAVVSIFFAAYVLHKIIRRIIFRQSKKGRIGEEQAEMLSQIVAYIVFVGALLYALDSLGVKLTALLFGSAALLVGLGFGLQQLFQDIISGIILLFDKNINVRDVVQSEKFIGKIQHIGLRATRILTTDNLVVIVPNSAMISNNLINLSHSRESARFRIKVGVAYGSDVQKVKEVLYACAIDHEKAENDPPPQIFFTDFGDSALNFELRFWSTNIFSIETVASDLRFMIESRFRENDIKIPFPQRDIHIQSDTNKIP